MIYNNIQNFGKKITLIVTSLVALAVILITIISFYINRQTVREFYRKNVEHHNNLFADNLREEIYFVQDDLKSITNKKRLFTNPYLRFVSTLNGSDSMRNKYAELNSYFKNEIFKDLAERNEIEDILLLNTSIPDPVVVFKYSSTEILNAGDEFKNIDNNAINTHVKEPFVNHPIYESGIFYTYLSSPIKIDEDQIGMVMVKINLSKLSSKIQIQDNFLSRTKVINEVLKLEKKNEFKIYTSEDTSKSFFSDMDEKLYSEVVDNWMKCKFMYSNYNIKNRNQINFWQYDQDLGICILTKVQIGISDFNYANFNYITILIGVGIIAISLVLALYFSRVISYPIIKLKKVLRLISKGVLPQKMNTPLQDEVGEMINTVNKIVESLKRTAAFAQKIGNGEFDSDFRPVSKQDILGNALLDMSKSLQYASTKDEVRNWIIEGLARLGAILRNFDNIQEISEEVIQFICHRVEALQGAMFLVNDENPSNPKLVLQSTYAYGKHKNLKREFQFGEGIVGQCAVEKIVILRSEIPENYLIITSGLLGEQTPSHLLVVPLIYNDKVYGVIELASLAMFGSDKTDFMEEVSAIISRTIFNIKVNENTRDLLEQSQQLSLELTEKKEQLEQNANKMAKNQQEITETNQKLQVQIAKVREAQERQTALLTNSDEVIFILNQVGLVNYVSPSITRILGYHEEDILNSRDGKRVSENYQNDFENFLANLLDSKEKEQKIQYEYYKKNGDLVWLEAVGINEMDNVAINGLVLNVRDITIKKQAEEEQRKRTQMQSLSENSTDLIMRIGLSKEVFYANPIIETYTGVPIANLLSKKINETVLNSCVGNAYVEMLEAVSKTNGIVELEADFKNDTRHEIFSIRGIPEYDDLGKLESVLMISHNVTIAKTNEREVKEKNKQIEDSIYYAENIQKVLLPDTYLLSKYIFDSFIFFKPRDIVSGDFPWIKEHNGYLYIAAVDCTGHGVPGAMIATVGYFLLNSILKENQTPTASEVLNQLDKLVTETFRQNDEDSKLKDGMDLVLCRIKIGTSTVDVASANRPILHLNSQNELIEIKGNKFPIGGGNAYEKTLGFKNHEFNFLKGESIYIFSDGLQDQFNANGNLKFGSKQIKNWVEQNGKKSPEEKLISLQTTFENWKGKTDQTDDVLFIGLGF